MNQKGPPMEIELDTYNDLAARGRIRQGSWGDGRERACLMSALVTGATSTEDCAAKGWPLWLAEIAVFLFDAYPADAAVARGRALAAAIHAADARGIDWDAVFRRVRLDAILPIALDSVGDGDEPWRVKCRRVVQWSIDNDGQPTRAAEATRAARAAGAARGAWAAGAAWAAWAAGGAVGAWGAWAAEAAEAAEAAAVSRIDAALINAINSCK